MPKHASRNRKSGTARRGPSEREVEMLNHDVEARMAGPDKQNWTIHDLKTIDPRTPNQATALRAWFEGDHVGLLGSPGAGKTLLACYMAASALVRKEVGGIIVVRSAVERREQGFVPGTQEEKDAKFEDTYRDGFAAVFGNHTAYDQLKRRGLITFRTTGNQRGLNFRNSVVIGDEIQNLDFAELHAFITRLCADSRLIICGDQGQCDLKHHEEPGLPIFQELAAELPDLTLVHFTRHDCQRHPFVKAWLRGVEDWYARRAAGRKQPAKVEEPEPGPIRELRPSITVPPAR